MISQEISRSLYESLKDVHSKNIKEFVEKTGINKRGCNSIKNYWNDAERKCS
jgi:hypothetical protein